MSDGSLRRLLTAAASFQLTLERISDASAVYHPRATTARIGIRIEIDTPLVDEVVDIVLDELGVSHNAQERDYFHERQMEMMVDAGGKLDDEAAQFIAFVREKLLIHREPVGHG